MAQRTLSFFYSSYLSLNTRGIPRGTTKSNATPAPCMQMINPEPLSNAKYVSQATCMTLQGLFCMRALTVMVMVFVAKVEVRE